MQKQKWLKAFPGLLAVLLVFACGEEYNQPELDTSKLSPAALKGKKLFDKHKCVACHSLGKRTMTVVRQGKEVVVPDLTNPFIANDSAFVAQHLRFVERSDMPPIKLKEEEIKQISRFVAELHAAMHATVSREEADAACAITGAPVLKSEAKAKGLWYTYLDSTYYFVSEECKELFIKAPAAFASSPQ